MKKTTNLLKIRKKTLKLALCHLLLAVFFVCQSFANSVFTVTGKVIDAITDEPITGASVLLKGTSKGTITDEKGSFTLALDDAEKNGTLVISFVGYDKQEVAINGQETINIRLTGGADLEEVVVTGVFDKRTKMSASVAISTLNSKQLERMVPVSAVDLLKNIPGVFVNSSKGEVESSIYSRGMSYAGGFYYVSMQEDGLPIMSATFSLSGSTSMNPDAFLRADANIARVEAVRGGTASILGANAPGGIFNYVTKTGGTTFEGEARTRLGLEGDGKNAYYRADVNFGGPLSKDKSITYNVGGFYRHANGAKYPGYPLNRGGQLRGNILKNYNSGSLKLWVKYMDDHTGPYEFTPSVNFTNPMPAGAFNNTSSVLVQPVSFKIPAAITGGLDFEYNTKNVRHYIDKAIGMNWEQKLGNGLTFTNALKYAQKATTSNSTQIVFPFAVDKITFYGVAGMAARFGTYEFYDPTSNKSYGTVQQLPPTGPAGIRFISNNLTLPGSDVMPNGLFYTPNPYVDIDISEFIDQAQLTKKLDNMTFTLGGFLASSTTERYAMIPSAQSFSTIEDQPKLVGIRFTPLGTTKPYQFTDNNGIANYGGAGYYYNKGKVNQSAVFFGHNWEINKKINLDWGLRYENFGIKATFSTPQLLPNDKFGIDGDSLTLYDNRIRRANPQRQFQKSLGTLSYSAGINYLIRDGLALYARYSQGRKSPDLAFYFDFANQEAAASLTPQAQSSQQIEFGLKVKNEKLNLFITPFFSLLSSVPNYQVFQDTNTTYYSPPLRYQKLRTYGVEIEANYAFNKHFSIRTTGVLQQFKAIDFTIFLANANGKTDDKEIVYSGNKTDNIAPVMFNITPTYTGEKFYAALNWQYMGKRWGNVANAFELPAFNNFDLNLGYNLTKKLHLSVTINNLLNTYGVMGWAAPGGFPAALDTQGFTKTALDANPNAIYSTLSIQPRAYFLTASYKF